MSRLNKTQQYAIRWLHSQNKTDTQIANELNITTDQVIKALEKTGEVQSETNIKTAKSNVSRSKNLMISETSAKKSKNVSIMTREASEYNDSIKNRVPNANPNTQKAIFRPKDNE